MPDPEARAQRLVRFLGGWPSYLRCGDATARCAAAAVATLESALESATAGAGGGGGTAEERRERRRLARGATASAPAGRRRCVSERRTGTGACAYVLDTPNWGDGGPAPHLAPLPAHSIAHCPGPGARVARSRWLREGRSWYVTLPARSLARRFDGANARMPGRVTWPRSFPVAPRFRPPPAVGRSNTKCSTARRRRPAESHGPAVQGDRDWCALGPGRAGWRRAWGRGRLPLRPCP